jgi:hypothetical protein
MEASSPNNDDTIAIKMSESPSKEDSPPSNGASPPNNKDIKSPENNYISNKDDLDSAFNGDATDIAPEPDNLHELDTKTITPLKSETEELIRLFRSISTLTPIQIRVIELRYLGLLKNYATRIIYIDFLHHFMRSFVSLGSVIVPALLSIQSPTSPSSVGLYWTTWLISLLVTSFHNLVTIFRFDKKFFAIHNTYERLQTEGWSYLQLSGRYSGHRPLTPSITPTHKNQFQLFMHTVEKIQMRQITDEYNGRTDDKQQQQQQPQPSNPLTTIPSPQPTNGITDQSPLDSLTSPPVKK